MKARCFVSELFRQIFHFYFLVFPMAKRNTIVSTEREIIAQTSAVSYEKGRIFLKRTKTTRAAMSTNIWMRLAFFAAFMSFFSSAFLAMRLFTKAAAAPHTIPKSTANKLFTALPPFILSFSYYYIYYHKTVAQPTIFAVCSLFFREYTKVFGR